MLCCAWSPCGTFIAAGNKDCNAYMWHWDVGASTPHCHQQQPPHQQDPPAAAAAPGAAGAQQQQQLLLHSADWPNPVPLPTLAGHNKGVWQVEFNHAGTLLASGSTDGSVRVRTSCLCLTLLTFC
jgi:WD40 repeat protein